MKNKNLIIKLLLLILVPIAAIFTDSTSAKAMLCEFDVISDTHIVATSSDTNNTYSKTDADNKLIITLDSIRLSYPNTDCIVINGDVVENNHSYYHLYLLLKDYVSQHPDVPYIYFNIGNHEYNEGYNGTNYSAPQSHYSSNLWLFNSQIRNISSLIKPKKWITTYQEKGFKRNNSYDLQYINGKNTKMLFLGTDAIMDDPCEAILYSNQANFLNSMVNQSSKSNGPMFMFLHQPLYHTTYGSYDEPGGFANGYLEPGQSDYVKSILNGHPEIILFTAHDHVPFSSSSSDPWNYSHYDESTQSFSVPSISASLEGYHVGVYSDGAYVEGVSYTGTSCQHVNGRTVCY